MREILKGRRRLAVVVGLGLVACATACGDGTDDALDIPEPVESTESALSGLVDEPNDAVTQTPWSTIGAGVSYKQLGFGRENILIVYGGYKAEQVWVERWANALYRVKGLPFDVGHVYAVRGPNQSGYANREIGNSKIAAHIGNGGRAALASSIYVIGHSSGTYVADELFGQIKNGAGGVPFGTLGKVRLYNLDGGGVASAATLNAMNRAYFVWAHDGAINRDSHNASSMKILGDRYASKGGDFEVNATGSGCSRTASGGLWCLHDTVINTRPFNPSMYDLKNDYTNFTGGRKVVTSYLDAP
jgi:hypothetical protein